MARNQPLASDKDLNGAKEADRPPVRGAVVQRDGSLAIVPHVPCGIVSPALLRRIADVGERFGCIMKLTSAGRVAIVGLNEGNVAEAWQALEMEPGQAVGPCVRSVRACAGTAACAQAHQDALGVGLSLDAALHGRACPSVTKVAVSGCSNDCSEVAVHDIGLVGCESGWKLMLGGNVGRKPRIGKVFSRNLDTATATHVIDRVLALYDELAIPGERLGAVIARVGAQPFEDAARKAAASLQ